MAISLRVNGVTRSVDAEPDTPLLYVLRNDLELNGAKYGCALTQCGACTVLVNGNSARACLMLAVQCDGQEVATVESLATDKKLNVLQQAFQDNHGLQCGFCTPGMLMTLTEFLRDHPEPGEAQVRDVLSGNLCRCTGYQGIIDAALDAAKKMREAEK